MKRRIKLQGALIFLAIIITFWLSNFVFPHWRKESIDEFLDALGIVLILFGFLFRISSRGYKEEKSSQGKNLVQDGPYYLMRHPMYFGTLLIGTGIISVLFEMWAFILFLIIYFSIYIPQIKKEESVLFSRFGEEYKNYCKTTPKYFPKFPHLLHLGEYILLRVSWIKKELFAFIMVITAILAIEIWQDTKLFGHREFFKELSELSFVILLFVILIFLILKITGKRSVK